jgi:ferredoxin
LFLKPSQFFKLNSNSSFKVPVPIISDKLTLTSDFFGKRLQPFGEFPRRVSIGDALFHNDIIKIPSPINGIIDFEEPTRSIHLRIDGELFCKPKFQRLTYDLSELKKTLMEMGIGSLDFPGIFMQELLSKFQDGSDACIVLSPFTQENFIDYKSKIQEGFSSEYDQFKKNLSVVFPKAVVLDFVSDKKIPYAYPDGNPSYFIYKYCSEKIADDFPFEKYLYLGAETIFHILRALYQKIPFYERYVAVNVINRSGTLEGETQVFSLRNGINLAEFLNGFKDKYNYNCFTINSFFDKQPVYEIGTEFIYDIYRHHAIIICDDLYGGDEEGICIDCNDCSYYCPVQADPRILLEKNKSTFKKDICIDCGICSVFCPAHIDFTVKIADIKRGLEIAIT